MQAPEDNDKEGSGGVVHGAGPPSSPGESPVGPEDGGSPVGPEEGGSMGVESAAAEGAPQGEEVSVTSGQAGQASASDRHLERQSLVLALTVPFQSYLNAEVARTVLSRGAESYDGMVHWEFTVTGNQLTIQLTAEDSDLLQNAAASLINRLYIVFQNIQHFEPQLFTFQRSKGF